MTQPAGRSDPLPGGLAAALDGRHLPSLDGLRAIAVGAVILAHAGIAWAPSAYGVLMFFVLSGFLITWLMLQEEARTGGVSLRAFYVRRTLRIFPAFYVYWFGLVGLLLLLGRMREWPQAWSAFFYVSNYYNALHGDPNTGLSHTWSLATEEQFYLLWPPLFVALGRRARHLPVVLGGAIVALWAYRLALVEVLHVDQAYRYAAFDTRCDALLVGVLTAVLLHRGLLPGLWRSLTASPVLPAVTAGLLLLVIRGGSSERYRDAVGFTLAAPLVAILLVQLLALHAAAPWRFLEHPAIRYVGRISYSLYLYQQVTLDVGKKLAHAYPYGVQLASALALTLVVASASYYLVEKPFLRLKDRFHGTVPVRRAPAGANAVAEVRA